MAALNMTSYQAALKEMYPTSRIENMTFQNNPLLAMLPKDTNVGGESWKLPVQYEDIAGRSASFSTAQSNKAASKKVAFNLTAVNDYALASVEGKVWRASQGNTKAFLEASKSELDSAFNAMRRSLGISVYRNGNGWIGRIDTTVTGTTLTVTNRHDINNFFKGANLVFSASETGALRTSTATVTSINRTAGTMVITPTMTAGDLADDDYIFIEGDAPAGGDAVRMSGLLGWLPTSAPTVGDSFFGTDRSVDSVRLAGNVVNAAGLSVEEAFIRACTEVSEQGGIGTHLFCPYNIWEQLGLELGSKKEYTDTEVAGIHFKGLKIYSPDGEVKVYADRNCPQGNAFLLTLKEWTLYSIGACPGILDLDRVGSFLREASADAYELRVGCYPQMGTQSPGHNAVLTNLPAGV